MPYKIIYLDEAKQDVMEAKAWYKIQRTGLEKKFAEAVIKTILRLRRNPKAFAVRHSNLRIIHTERFPFGIHFYIDESKNNIVITAIVHDKRDM